MKYRLRTRMRVGMELGGFDLSWCLVLTSFHCLFEFF